MVFDQECLFFRLRWSGTTIESGPDLRKREFAQLLFPGKTRTAMEIHGTSIAVTCFGRVMGLMVG